MKGMGTLGPTWPPRISGAGVQGPTCPPAFGAYVLPYRKYSYSLKLLVLFSAIFRLNYYLGNKMEILSRYILTFIFQDKFYAKILNFSKIVTCETNQLDNELIIYCIGDICKYIVVK